MAINIWTSIPNFQGTGRRRRGEIDVEAPEELPSGRKRKAES
jgi:hypothetical protein